MSVLFYGLLLIVLSSVVHLIVWKVHLPEKQIGALLKIFALMLILGTVFLFKFHEFIRWSILPSINSLEIAQFLLLFVSIAMAYIVSYPAIEADSPTLIIINAVSEKRSQGLDQRELKKMMNNDLLIAPRIRDMVSDNMIYCDGGRYKLMLKGIIMTRVFLFYRRIIRGAKGG